MEKTLQEMETIEILEILLELARDLRDIHYELMEREVLPVPDHERSSPYEERSDAQT